MSLLAASPRTAGDLDQDRVVDQAIEEVGLDHYGWPDFGSREIAERPID